MQISVWDVLKVILCIGLYFVLQRGADYAEHIDKQREFMRNQAHRLHGELLFHNDHYPEWVVRAPDGRIYYYEDFQH